MNDNPKPYTMTVMAGLKKHAGPKPCPVCAKRLKAQRRGIKTWRRQRDIVEKLHRRGLDLAEIVASSGLAEWQVKKLIPPAGGHKRGGRPRSMTPEELKPLLLAGMTANEIAEKLNCNVSTVYRYWNELLERQRESKV